jgi:glucose dehydrogenase
MTLADLAIDGRKRRVLIQAPKNGFFYVINRKAGKPISAGKIGKVTWAERIDLETGSPIEASNGRYDQSGKCTIWPSSAGAHSWQSMSYDPKIGLVVDKHILGFSSRSRISLARSMTLKQIQASDSSITGAVLTGTDVDFATLSPDK